MTSENETTPPTSGTGKTSGDIKPPQSISGTSETKKHRKRGFRKPIPTVITPRQPKFEGKCEELKGHIYDCSDTRQSDIFMKTTKEIAEYAGRTFKKGDNVRLAIKNLSLPTLVLPADPDDDTNKTMNRIWEKEVDEYVKRKTYLEDNMKTVHSLVWGQCTDVMRQKLESLDTFDTITANGDGLALLKAIKDPLYNFQSQKYLPRALHESKRQFYLCAQRKFSTTPTYLEQFQNTVDVIEHSGGTIGRDPGIMNALAAIKRVNIGNMEPDAKDNLAKEAQEQYLAVAFLLSADNG
jgi:hypothetical protein